MYKQKAKYRFFLHVLYIRKATLTFLIYNTRKPKNYKSAKGLLSTALRTWSLLT